MDVNLLRRYLNGSATDSERRQCEAYLSDPEAVVELDGEPVSDSLLETLRVGCGDTDEVSGDDGADAHLESLMRKVEKMATRHAIGSEELARILDPPREADELGRLARFRVIEFIAGGGMGLVFRAEDPELDRPVCIKVMNPLLASRGDAKQRFEIEAKAASRLQHERIVTVFEVGEYRDLPYLVMELLEGESLRERLRRKGQLPAAEASKIVAQVAEGLRYAHARGFLHRDIKPDNIWLTQDENVKLLDFGLARALDESHELTHSGAVVGTPRYMSPEQVQSRTLEATSDLFSLGIVLYEMLTGRSPFERANVFSTLMSVANDTVSASWDEVASPVPQQLRELVARLLAKDPQKRPASAGEVIRTLHDPTGKSTPDASSTGGLGRIGAGIAGVLAGCLALLLGIWIYQTTDKGTLVVEADPSVEVQVKNETVTVKEPLSGKSYTVRIGSQPLPSGVYQLELADAASGLTLSSQVVTIRRNQKQLVTISLRSNAGGSASSTDAVPRLNRDEPFDLAALPALNAADTERALGLRTRKSLSPSALVPDPAPMTDIRSWSLEPIRRAGRNDRVKLSRDGKRIAQSANDGFIRILDDRFELQLMLPVTDAVIAMEWSPQADVLLVLCQGRLAKEALLWRINEKQQGELLRRIPVEGERAAWSWQGDRIAFESRAGVTFYDVRKARMYAIAGAQIQGVLNSRSWSSDGQHFATTVEDSVKVWSLADGGVVHIFPQAYHPQWLAEGKRMAIRRRAGAQWIVEIWSVTDLSREKAFSIPPQWVSNSLQIDQNGRTLSAITKEAKLVAGVEGQANSPLVTAQDVEEGVISPNENVLFNLSDIELSADGRRILVKSFRRYAMFELTDDASISRLTSWTDFGFRLLSTLTPTLDVNKTAAFLSISHDEKLGEIKMDILDLSSLESTGVVQTNSHPPDTFYAQAFASVSPDGRHGLLREQFDGPLHLVDLVTGKSKPVSENPILAPEFHWSRDGRYAIGVMQSRSRRGSRRGLTFHIVDVKSSSCRSFDPIADFPDRETPALNADAYQLVGDRLYVIINQGAASNNRTGRAAQYDRRYRFVLECYDISTLQLVKTLALGEFATVGSVCVLDDQVMWFGNRLRARSLGTWTVYSAKLADPSNVLEGVSGLPQARRVIPSHDGKYVLFGGEMAANGRTSYFILASRDLVDPDSGVKNTSLSWHEMTYRPTARIGSRPPMAIWHSTRNHVAIILKNSIKIRDLEKSSEFEVLLEETDYKRAIPAAFGWAIQTDDRLLAYSFDGKFIGSWLDTRSPDAKRFWSLPTRWVHANGSTRGTKDSDKVCLVQLVGNQAITIQQGSEAWSKLPAETVETLGEVLWPWSE